MPHSQRGPRPAATVFVLITILLDTLGVGLIIPVAPRLVASFVGNDLHAASHFFGFLFSLYAAMQFVSAPVLGGLSDRFGRRPIILISLLGAGASYLVSGFAPSLGWLFLGRTVSGITGASYSAAGAYIADVTQPDRRAQAFGLLGAAFGLGFILGPALGGVLGDVGLRIPYFVAAALNFVNLLYGLFVLPESLTRENRRPFSLRRSNPIGALRKLGRDATTVGLAGSLFCLQVAQMMVQGTWALYHQARFGWSLRGVGLSLMVAGLAIALVQGGLVRPVTQRVGERAAVIVGLLFNLASDLAFAFADRSWIVYAILFPLAFGGLVGPAVQAILTRASTATEQGELQGSINSLSGVAAICGPLLGTTLLARFPVGPGLPGAAFLAAALVTVGALVLAIPPRGARSLTARE